MSAIDLIVLGMIKSQPQSAYDLQKNVEYRNISKWVKVSTPSIYKKVVQLEEKGYIRGKIIQEGKMPQKTQYQITGAGELRFMKLMEETSGKMMRVFLEFNAVIMSLDLVPQPDKKKLLDQIETGIQDFGTIVEQKHNERQHIPLTGRTILDQQHRVAQVLAEWIQDFRGEYLEDE